jgi:hypothetical protein
MNKRKSHSKMVKLNSTVKVITLNVNGEDTQIKGQIVTGYIKSKTQVYSFQKKPPTSKIEIQTD